jgi:hypothetical protein
MIALVCGGSSLVLTGDKHLRGDGGVDSGPNSDAGTDSGPGDDAGTDAGPPKCTIDDDCIDDDPCHGLGTSTARSAAGAPSPRRCSYLEQT